VEEREARPSVDVTAVEFATLFASVQSWGRWGTEDELGALNRLTTDRVAGAARLVRSGTAVSLSLLGCGQCLRKCVWAYGDVLGNRDVNDVVAFE
jgi:hypothetical protein